jgi:hypothetical protein
MTVANRLRNRLALIAEQYDDKRLAEAAIEGCAESIVTRLLSSRDYTHIVREFFADWKQPDVFIATLTQRSKEERQSVLKMIMYAAQELESRQSMRHVAQVSTKLHGKKLEIVMKTIEGLLLDHISTTQLRQFTQAVSQLPTQQSLAEYESKVDDLETCLTTAPEPIQGHTMKLVLRDIPIETVLAYVENKNEIDKIAKVLSQYPPEARKEVDYYIANHGVVVALDLLRSFDDKTIYDAVPRREQAEFIKLIGECIQTGTDMNTAIKLSRKIGIEAAERVIQEHHVYRTKLDTEKIPPKYYVKIKRRSGRNATNLIKAVARVAAATEDEEAIKLATEVALTKPYAKIEYLGSVATSSGAKKTIKEAREILAR